MVNSKPSEAAERFEQVNTLARRISKSVKGERTADVLMACVAVIVNRVSTLCESHRVEFAALVGQELEEVCRVGAERDEGGDHLASH